MGESEHLSPIVASPPWSSPGRLGREVAFVEISCQLATPCNHLMSGEMAMTWKNQKSDFPELLESLPATVILELKATAPGSRRMVLACP